MKKILTAVAVLFVSLGALAQGTVNFSNGAAGVNAPIRDVSGALAAGTGFIAQLWAGATAGSLAPISPTATFATGASAGYFFGGSRTVPGVATGSPAFVQVRVWNSGFADWASAFAAYTSGNAAAQIGGDLVTAWASPNLGGGPTPPANLIGMQSFQLRQVPEPSTIALAALGAAALLFRRRK
jgi:hypothetical protein